MAYTPNPNKYPGNCVSCSARVEAQAGFLGRKVDGRWTVICRPCKTGEAAPEAPVAAQAAAYKLTDEQLKVIDLVVHQGLTIAVEAGAGAGKTSTLKAIAKELGAKGQRGQYVAFNRKIVDDAQASFTKDGLTSINAASIHKLAFHAGGKAYTHRWSTKAGSSGTRRNTLSVLASQLRIEPFEYELNGEAHVIQPRQLASYVRRAVTKFAQSDATEVNVAKQLGYIDGIDRVDPETLSRDYLNNDKLKAHLQFHAETLWADYALTDGQLPGFDQGLTIKLWALGVFGPCRIDADYILVDEAQDLSGVMLQVLRQQSVQIVLVGDTQQTINEWMGSRNALAEFKTEATAWLTNSFRFGPQIATAANKVLSSIDNNKLQLTGLGKPGRITELTNGDVDAILTRTNAGTVAALLNALESGKKVHVVGDAAKDLLRFVQAAQRLQDGLSTDHEELSAFSSWGEVVAWVKEDEDASDLQLWVDIIEKFSTQAIIDGLQAVVGESQAQITISTTHRSKGREWNNVKIWGDWNANRTGTEELRLLYVAVTRAKLALDYGDCATARKIIDGEED